MNREHENANKSSRNKEVSKSMFLVTEAKKKPGKLICSKLPGNSN